MQRERQQRLHNCCHSQFMIMTDETNRCFKLTYMLGVGTPADILNLCEAIAAEGILPRYTQLVCDGNPACKLNGIHLES